MWTRARIRTSQLLRNPGIIKLLKSCIIQKEGVSTRQHSQSVCHKSVVYAFLQAAYNHHKNPNLKPIEKWQNSGMAKAQWELTLRFVWPELTVQATGKNKAEAERQAYAKVVQHLQDLKLLSSEYKAQLVSAQDKERQYQSNVAAYPLMLSDNIVKEIKQFLLQQTENTDALPNDADYQNGKEKLLIDIITGKPFQTRDKNELEKRSRNLMAALYQRRQSISPTLLNIQEKRECLPIYSYRENILKLIEDNRVVVLSGETGCGKTTQVPQYILDHYINEEKGAKCNIIVTQPRRLSAVTIAERVAYERGELTGDNIGYKVRHEGVQPQRRGGSMLFCTTGILLQFLKRNPLLRGISHVIIDEAHERDVFIDFLMTFLKDVLNVNPNVHLVIMSASINEKKLSKYFNDCPIIYVPGFMHSVNSVFLEQIKELRVVPVKKNSKAVDETFDDEDKKLDFELVVNLIWWITLNRPPGAILCFVPGWQEIQMIRAMLEEGCGTRASPLVIHSVHSEVPRSEQMRIFNEPPTGVRKVILSTNIAETSITINDVVYVIDTGVIKQTVFDPDYATTTLARTWVSKANVKQRRGRAGRTRPGECYHLYPQKLFDEFECYPLPEIQRMSLEHVVLNSKIYCPHHSAKEYLSFVPDPPSTEAIDQAVIDLKKRGFLTAEEDLTLLGKLVANFPLHPYLGKALIYSFWLSCLEPTLTIVSYLNSGRSLFAGRLMNRSEIAKAKEKFEYGSDSDHVTIVNMVNSWLQAQEYSSTRGEDFLRTNLLNRGSMKYVYDTRKQIQTEAYKMLHLYSIEAVDDRNMLSSEQNAIIAVLSAGFAPNFIKRLYRPKKANKISFLEVEGGSASIAKDSVCSLGELNQSWLTYFSAFYSDNSGVAMIDDLSVASPLSILIFGGKKISIHDSQPNPYPHYLLEHVNLNHSNLVVLTVDDNKRMTFICEKEVGKLILQFHELIQRHFERFVNCLACSASSELAIKEREQHKPLIDLLLRCLRDSSQEDCKLYCFWKSKKGS